MKAAIFNCQCDLVQNCEGGCETIYAKSFVVSAGRRSVSAAGLEGSAEAQPSPSESPRESGSPRGTESPRKKPESPRGGSEGLEREFENSTGDLKKGLRGAETEPPLRPLHGTKAFLCECLPLSVCMCLCVLL